MSLWIRRSRLASNVGLCFALVLLGLNGVAVADSGHNLVCQDQTTDIARAISSLDKVEAWIPNVPPDEASYLSNEYHAIFSSRLPEKTASARYALLTSRPYFRAWQLRDAIDTARRSLRNVDDLPSGSTIKDKLKAASMTPYHLSEAKMAWGDYITADNGKTLTSKQIADGTFMLGGTLTRVQQYIWCWADKLPGE